MLNPLRKISTLMGATLLSTAASFLSSVIVARTVAPDNFGIYAALVALVLMLAQLLDAGFNQQITQRCAIRSSTRLAFDVISLRLLAALSATACLGLALLAGIEFHALQVYLLAPAAAFWSMVYQADLARVQGLRQMRLAGALILLPGGLRLFTALLVLFKPSLESFLLAYAVSAMVLGAFSGWRNRGSLWIVPRLRLIKRMMYLMLLASCAIALAALLYRTGVWMALLLGGAAPAGRYSVAFQMASSIFILAAPVTAFLTPEFAQLDRRGELYSFLSNYLRKMAVGLLLAAPIVYVAAQATPFIFGPKYTGLESVTFILACSFILSLAVGPFYVVQQIHRRFGLLTFLHAVQILLLLAGCLILVPRYGILGVAAADLLMRIIAVTFCVIAGLIATKPLKETA